MERLVLELLYVSNGFILQITIPSNEPDVPSASKTFVAASPEDVKKIIGNNVLYFLGEEPEQRVRTIKGKRDVSQTVE